MFPFLKIQQLLDLGRAKEAEQMIRLELSKSPENDDLFLLLARACLELNKTKATVEAAHQAIALEPNNDFAFFILALGLLQQNKYREAHEAIDQGLMLNSENAELYGLRARAFGEKNKPKKALEAAETGLAIDPQEELCRFYRSLALSNLGRHEDAQDQTLDLLSDDADDSYNHSVNGWIRLQSGDSAGAERSFLESLRINADNKDARLGLAQALKHRNPLVSWLLRSVQWLTQLNWVVFLIAIFGLGRLSGWLMNTDNSPAFILTGLALRVMIPTLFIFWVLAALLGSLALSLTKTGRLALPEREKLALKWTFFPLILTFIFLAFNLYTNARLLPSGAYSWAPATALLFGAISHHLSWVRLRLYFLSIIAILLAIWVSTIAPFILWQKAQSLLTALESLNKDAAKAGLDALIKNRLHYIIYPTTAAWLIGAFHNEISEWLESKAPDEDSDYS